MSQTLKERLKESFEDFNKLSKVRKESYLKDVNRESSYPHKEHTVEATQK